MPIVRKIDPPPPVVRRVYERTFLERYPVLEPPPPAVLTPHIAGLVANAGTGGPLRAALARPGHVIRWNGLTGVVLAMPCDGGLDVWCHEEAREECWVAARVSWLGKLPRISRVTSRTKGDAWLAKFYREKQETSRHFAVRRYGGVLGALCAAVAATAETWPGEGT